MVTNVRYKTALDKYYLQKEMIDNISKREYHTMCTVKGSVSFNSKFNLRDLNKHLFK